MDNLGKQETREKAFAEARLVERVEARKAVEAEVDVKDRGELNLSDPGSAGAGRQAAGDSDESPAPAKKTAAKRTTKRSGK